MAKKTTQTDTFPNRVDIVMLYDVLDGNPNGDPDDANNPRVDQETRMGLVTDVCIKRKLRDMLAELKGGEDGFDIFITTDEHDDADRILNDKMKAAYEKLGLKAKEEGAVAAARDFMCKTFIDVRTFGAVMATGKNDGDSENRYNAGKVTGPLQIGFGRSIDPVSISEHCITRKCVTAQKDAKKQIDQDGTITGTMGRKSTVAYGLYRQFAWYSPARAAKTGFSVEDFKAVLKALTLCFGADRSAARGRLSFRGAYVFVHESPLGNAHDFELFDSVSVTTESEHPRAFSDYELKQGDIPKGVKLHVVRHASDVDAIFG